MHSHSTPRGRVGVAQVFLDLDVVLLRPLDALFSLPLPTHYLGYPTLAAVGLGGGCPRVLQWEPFNGGALAGSNVTPFIF